MTTYSWTGLVRRYDWFSGITADVGPSVLTIVAPDAENVVGYSVLESGPNEPDSVELSALEPYRFEFDGTAVAVDEIFIGRILWNGNATDYITFFTEGTIGIPKVDRIFVLAGTPLPAMTTPAEWNAFSALITSVGGITSGPTAPGALIPLAGLTGMVVSENDVIFGTPGNDTLAGGAGHDWIGGAEGADTLDGGDGVDALYGGGGDDFIFGGASAADLRDVIEGGNGNDNIDAGYGNDEVSGGGGNDTVAGGFGSDTLIGNSGNDVLTGSALSDMVFGADGADFVNGGFGSDRINGGPGADRFYHLGIPDHGSDWVQDYAAAAGDLLTFGQPGATPDQFRVNFAYTPNAGQAAIAEAFVIYRPSGQIVWALIDGAAQTEINLTIAGSDAVHDLI